MNLRPGAVRQRLLHGRKELRRYWIQHFLDDAAMGLARVTGLARYQPRVMLAARLIAQLDPRTRKRLEYFLDRRWRVGALNQSMEHFAAALRNRLDPTLKYRAIEPQLALKIIGQQCELRMGARRDGAHGDAVKPPFREKLLRDAQNAFLGLGAFRRVSSRHELLHQNLLDD